jgi:hypothetical protein
MRRLTMPKRSTKYDPKKEGLIHDIKASITRIFLSENRANKYLEMLSLILGIGASIAGILAILSPEIRACLNLDRNAICPFRNEPTPRYGFYINGQAITLSINESLIEKRLGEARFGSEGVLSNAEKRWVSTVNGGVIQGAELLIGIDDSGAVDFAGIYLDGTISSAHAFFNEIQIIPGKTNFRTLITDIPNGKCIIDGYFEGHYGWSYMVYFGPEATQAMTFIAIVPLGENFQFDPEEELVPDVDTLTVHNITLSYTGYRTEGLNDVSCTSWISENP